MQHIRHTRQALSRLFSPERRRLSIAPAPGWRALGPGKAAAPGEGSSGEAAAPPARRPRPRRVRTDEFSATENSSHRATSYPRCPRRGVPGAFLLRGIATDLSPRRPLPAPPGAPSSAKSSPARAPSGRQSSLESSQQRRAEPLLPPARGEEATPSAARLPQPKARRDRDAGAGSSRRAGHCPLAGSWLVFPRLVFQLIAPGTGGTMPGCSPRSRLPARGFCPNHVPGPERCSRDAAPLGTRGDNGGRLITTSLPLLLNIIPLQPFCRLLPRPGG